MSNGLGGRPSPSSNKKGSYQPRRYGHRISYVTRSQLFTSAPRYVWGQESAQKAHGILWIHNIPWIRFGAFGLRASTWRRRCERFLSILTLYTLLHILTLYLPQLTGAFAVAINIKNPEVERLVAEISSITGENKTEAVRRSLEERRERLAFRADGEGRASRLKRFLEQEVWPIVPKEELGRTLTEEEEEVILGYGKEGV